MGRDRIAESPEGEDLFRYMTCPLILDADIERALASGFARHFTKPIDIDDLQRALLELAAEAGA
jgi:CheY-like chemotaxis protein